jgi:hypothetical protein
LTIVSEIDDIPELDSVVWGLDQVYSSIVIHGVREGGKRDKKERLT